MDERIATGVMGLTLLPLEAAPCPYCEQEMRFCGERSWCSQCSEWRYGPAKEYSLENADAIDALEHHGKEWQIRTEGSKEYGVWVWKPNDGLALQGSWVIAVADTLAHAACLALLRSVGAA